MDDDRYGSDVLAGFSARKRVAPPPVLPVERGMILEHVGTDFCGEVIRADRTGAELEDRFGTTRFFPYGPGFLHEGAPVALAPPARKKTGPARTASGSFHVADAKARVARQSRIYVEGRHDAELVEKVWGADLRLEGVVVEYLEGVDRLEEALAAFKPGPGRRIGVLVDHLVPGSKESRIADGVARGPYGAHVLVVGHPFVDIWQAVKPARLGLGQWPHIPRTIEWKHGICEALRWPHADQADIAQAWQRILGRVSTYADLEPALLGRVEELIDFVTT